MTLEQKLEFFRDKLQKQQIDNLHRINCACEANIKNAECFLKPGKKYTKLDIGTCGKYMIDNDTQIIYGIKAYGQVNKKKTFGTLDTLDQYYWGDYHAIKIKQAKTA